MLQANELRSDNILIHDSIGYLKIDTIKPNSVMGVEITHGMNFEFYYNQVAAVPLTVELLKKLGFTPNREGDFLLLHLAGKAFGFEVFDNWSMKFRYRPKKGVGFNDPYIDVNYLHQLQNIIFMITGQELTITL